VFGSVNRWGWHFLASSSPIPTRTAPELLARIPPTAVADMMEWGPGKTPEQQLNMMLSQEITIDGIVAFSPSAPPLSDDRPMNEYYLVRSSRYY